MNKIFRFFLFMTMVFTISFSAMKDGSYSVEGKAAGGWQPFMKMTVKNQKIIGVQYDRKNSNGQLLSLDQKGNEKFKEKNGMSFRDATFTLSRSLIKTQNIEDLENINVPEATNEFKQLGRFLIEKANAGTEGNFTLD